MVGLVPDLGWGRPRPATAAVRRAVLAAVQGGLVAGQRLTPDDTAQLARLVVLGERRSPNAFLGACQPAALVALARAVIHSEECFGLFGRYAVWDGLDPEPEEEGEWAKAGFNPDSGRWNPARQVPVDADGIVGYTGGGIGGDGGGGGGG
ncbi:hypothetical protein GCM10027517_00690 [Phycicoccus ginsengisoli]